MTDHDDRLSRRYRELAREEPSAAIDAAILAAARRAVARPSASRRWAVPASIAAVLVLAFGVTLEMQREEPGIEYSPPAARSVAPPARERAQEPAASPAPEPVPLEKKSLPAPERKIAPSKRQGLAQPGRAPGAESFATREAPAKAAEPRPFQVAPAAPPAPAARPAAVAPQSPAAPAVPAGAENRAVSSPSSAADQALAPRAKLEATTSTSAGMMRVAPSPTAEIDRELERIARLRTEGHHAEANKALEEFRRKYPDFRIPEAMWERVKPR